MWSTRSVYSRWVFAYRGFKATERLVGGSGVQFKKPRKSLQKIWQKTMEQNLQKN